MKSEEIRILSGPEITKKIDEADRELVDLSIRVASRQLVDHRQIAKVRRRMAQLKTIQREKELGIR